jgi:hypothetical protein
MSFSDRVMPARLPLDPSRIAEIARAAKVCEQTVRRYRRINPDRTPVWHLHPSAEHMITEAIRALKPSAQLELQPVSPPAQQTTEHGTLTAPAGRSATPADSLRRRCRVTVVMPETVP